MKIKNAAPPVPAAPAAAPVPSAPALLALLVLLAPLLVLAFPGERRDRRNLFLVSPVEDFVFDPAKLDPVKLERLRGEDFLLTYEVRRRLRASAGVAGCPVTVIGTNSLYPLLVSCPPEEGSFFTAAAEKERSGHAVLNRAAAARLFGALAVTGGSFSMEGRPWLVSGVVDDGQEASPRVYIPAAIRGEGPRTLLVRSGGGQARVGEALKSLGAAGNDYRLFDLSRARGLRLGIALRILACALFALFARTSLRSLGTAALELKNRLRREYPGRLIREALRLLTRRLPVLAALAAGTALCLRLARGLLDACLRLRDLPPLRDLVSGGEFPALVAALRTRDRTEFAAFAVFLAACCACGFFAQARFASFFKKGGPLPWEGGIRAGRARRTG